MTWSDDIKLKQIYYISEEFSELLLIIKYNLSNILGGFLFSSLVHGGRCAACSEAHTNFADESPCLTAEDIRNEVLTIHRSREVLKMLSLYK
jgi:hypothetical protein